MKIPKNRELFKSKIRNNHNLDLSRQANNCNICKIINVYNCEK